ncbi:MAG: hypothetical protein BJ554DRAFT_1094 [Olpidium bornovanus]|uniref:RNA methyltransferase n=1 Tax=Olpidium bornovanus TaxID=278681 RepID=A0A8H7ZSX1_9FUNG|nr:MAG: hypothetical protein BJ554DRAFT_1094 [Olpidium bornovanus]
MAGEGATPGTAVKRSNPLADSNGEGGGAPGPKRTKRTDDGGGGGDNGGPVRPAVGQDDAPDAVGIIGHLTGGSAAPDHDGGGHGGDLVEPDTTNPYVTGQSPARGWGNGRRGGVPFADASTLPSCQIYPHGNYRGYYKKRFPYLAVGTRDPRLCALPEGFFKHKRVLDVCPPGLPLSFAVNEHSGRPLAYATAPASSAAKLGAKRVIGIDIDDQLIKEARGNVLDRWSLTNPAPDDLQHQNQWADADVPFDYMPSCMPAIFGRRKVPAGRRRFPANLEFVAGDWLHDATERDRPGSFDVVFA